MSKATKIVAIVVILFIAVLTIWLPIALSDAGKRIDEAKAESVGSGNEILILACVTWQVSSVELRLSPTLEAKRSDLQAKFNRFKNELGSLESGEMALNTFRIDDSNLADAKLVAELSGVAKFLRGTATVTMTLVREPQNAWQLDSFDIAPSSSPSSAQSSE